MSTRRSTRISNRLQIRSSGFSLVEVMVSFTLLAGGLAGVAYMQNLSMQFGQESYNRSQILVSANELIDGMRALRIAANNDDTVTAEYTADLEPADQPCNPNLATPRNDLICFNQEVAKNLPYGTTSVSVNPDDDSYFDIRVFWSDRGLTEQAGFSNADISRADVNLNNEPDCNAATNRIWSSPPDITFQTGNGPPPNKHLCMIQHTWSVRILDPSVL